MGSRGSSLRNKLIRDNIPSAASRAVAYANIKRVTSQRPNGDEEFTEVVAMLGLDDITPEDE